MNAPFDKDRDLAGLGAHVDALRAAAPSAAQTDAAQQRLMARVASAQAAPRTRRTWQWVPAGALAALALAIVLVPMLSIRPALAFADVQRHFREFRTLVVTMTTRAGGGPPMTTQVSADDRGNVRVDVNDVMSVVVSADRKQVLHLLHQPRVARVEPLLGSLRKEDALAWLDELRAFQGQATLLPETRTIDGRTAHGWQLELQGMVTTLWATDDGLPLEMDVANGALLAIDFRFRFDGELDAATFATSAPEGYRQQ